MGCFEIPDERVNLLNARGERIIPSQFVDGRVHLYIKGNHCTGVFIEHPIPIINNELTAPYSLVEESIKYI